MHLCGQFERKQYWSVILSTQNQHKQLLAVQMKAIKLTKSALPFHEVKWNHFTEKKNNFTAAAVQLFRQCSADQDFCSARSLVVSCPTRFYRSKDILHSNAQFGDKIRCKGFCCSTMFIETLLTSTNGCLCIRVAGNHIFWLVSLFAIFATASCILGGFYWYWQML